MNESGDPKSKLLPYDPEGSPWEAQGFSQMPFKKNSEEMRAIERILGPRKRRWFFKRSAA